MSVRRRRFSLTSSLDQEEPESPQIKEEQEELCINQEGEQLVLKQEETDSSVLIPTHEKSDKDQTLYLSPDKTQSGATEQRLLSHNCHLADSQDHKGGKHGDSGEEEPKQNTQQHERDI